MEHNDLIAQMMVEEGGSGIYTARSIINDIEGNYFEGFWTGLRSMEFMLEGSPLPLTPADYTAYQSTFFNLRQLAANVFNTSLSKIGTSTDVEWNSANGSWATQRIICVFNSNKSFDGIRINNSHNSGATTAIGVKNNMIHMSSAAYTNDTPEAAIPGGVKIFDGTFAEHVAANVVDDQNLLLIP